MAFPRFEKKAAISQDTSKSGEQLLFSDEVLFQSTLSKGRIEKSKNVTSTTIEDSQDSSEV
jgi:hypothetical protein